MGSILPLLPEKKEMFVIVGGHKTRASKANKFGFPCMTTNDSRNSRQKVNLLKLTPSVFVQVLCFVLFCFCFCFFITVKFFFLRFKLAFYPKDTPRKLKYMSVQKFPSQEMTILNVEFFSFSFFSTVFTKETEQSQLKEIITSRLFGVGYSKSSQVIAPIFFFY